MALIIAEQSGKLHFSEINKKVFEFISDLPVIYWVLAGFLFTYLMFFIYPVFLNPEQRFAHFDNYLPEGDRVGMDIRAIHSLVQDWVLSRQYHYVDGGVWYPPFYNIFLRRSYCWIAIRLTS